MSKLTVATTQFACSWDLKKNLDQAEQLVREAAAKGAQLILLQELFATPYFCIEQDQNTWHWPKNTRPARCSSALPLWPGS